MIVGVLRAQSFMGSRGEYGPIPRPFTADADVQLNCRFGGLPRPPIGRWGIMAFTIKAQAISPKPFDVGKIQKEIQGALDSEGRRDQKEFAKTVEGWSSATRMTYETQIKADEASVWIGPSGSEEMVDKWRRIDEGTEPRSRTSATTMVFPFQGRGQSYIAKTKPRQFSSAGSWKKLGPITRTHNIHDHSIEAREWSKTLGEQRIKPFADDIQQAINRGLA